MSTRAVDGAVDGTVDGTVVGTVIGTAVACKYGRSRQFGCVPSQAYSGTLNAGNLGFMDRCCIYLCGRRVCSGTSVFT